MTDINKIQEYLKDFKGATIQKVALRLGEWKDDRLLDMQVNDKSIILTFENSGEVKIDFNTTKSAIIRPEKLLDRITMDVYDLSHPNGCISLAYRI
ncbi:MAG: hypothetical protein ACRC92_25995 [Peptostreptococcaceae bacterium]